MVADVIIQEFLVHDVSFVPPLTTNLLSVSCVHQKGLNVDSSESPCDPTRGMVTIRNKGSGSVVEKGIEHPC